MTKPIWCLIIDRTYRHLTTASRRRGNLPQVTTYLDCGHTNTYAGSAEPVGQRVRCIYCEANARGAHATFPATHTRKPRPSHFKSPR